MNSINDDSNNNDNNRSDSIDNQDLKYLDEKFQVPINLKKTFICSTTLFLLGIALFIIGFIEDVQAVDPTEGITFWCLGGIVMIPGGYYSYQFCKARRVKDPQDREDILNEIPEL